MQNYCSTIQTLVNNGNIVLQVIYGDNAEYFCVYEWFKGKQLVQIK